MNAADARPHADTVYPERVRYDSDTEYYAALRDALIRVPGVIDTHTAESSQMVHEMNKYYKQKIDAGRALGVCKDRWNQYGGGGIVPPRLLSRIRRRLEDWQDGGPPVWCHDHFGQGGRVKRDDAGECDFCRGYAVCIKCGGRIRIQHDSNRRSHTWESGILMCEACVEARAIKVAT